MSSPVPEAAPTIPSSPLPSPSPSNAAASPPPPETNSNASLPPPPDTNSTASAPPPASTSPNGSTPTASLPPPPNGLPPGALAGLIVGTALGAIIVLIGVGIFVFFYKRKKRREAESRLGGLPPQGPKDEHNTSRPQLWHQNNHPPTDNNVISLPKPTPPPGIGPMPYQSPAVGPASYQPPSTSSSLGPEKQFASPSPSILGGSWGTFTYEELATSTNGFSDANLLGQGGFGYVHKGVLHDGRVVAIKQLKAGSGQGEREFQAEIEIINRVHHRHLVSLVGYCITGDHRMLVYEFVSNHTLEFHLHGKGRPTMNWSTRMKIALGSAKGLAYLHEDCQPKIIHRDIKAANILLDDSFEAKVADFGLAKYSMDTDTHVSTRVMGTFGYLAPEYASSGKLTEKSDVFSFGVVLLELITGHRPVDRTQSFLDDSIVDWARPLLKQALEDGIYDPLVDPKLQDYDSSELTRMITCAAACIRHSARLRPRMSQIVRALEGNMPLDDLSDGITPGHSTMFGSYGSSEYNSIQYKEDLKKFRKMALESQEHGSSDYSGLTSDYGVHPSASSSEGHQTTQEMESQRKETTTKGFNESS